MRWPWRRRPPAAEEPGLDLRALRRDLEGVPQHPHGRSHPRHWWFRLKRTADFVGHSRREWAQAFRHLNPYPDPFEHVTIRTEDGVTIAGWYGPATGHDWGLVLVPGMFGTKDDTIHKSRAIRIWRRWKIPILAIDMRAFGESTGIATAGWKEAYDVHAAARWLAQKADLQRVGVMAESMGGAAALNALAHDHDAAERTGAPPVMTGGVLCWSAFMDARDAVSYISAEPPEDHPFSTPWRGFRRLLRLKSHGAYARFDEYLDDVARVNGLHGVDELYDLANPKSRVASMKGPVLAVHSTDDPVVPVRHARRMERYAKDMHHIQTLVVPWGGHAAFEAMDPEWTWEVMRRFFGTVNGVSLCELVGHEHE